MLIHSLSITLERGFEDIIEAVIENGDLNILGFNIEFPINDDKIAIVNIYNEIVNKVFVNIYFPSVEVYLFILLFMFVTLIISICNFNNWY